mmetsp:Transcript_43392/g.137166  ORF Transcript_43392/g.137166 Transcript_43392/m.137166 type:complete len:119 (-) Transcript_43392:3268-3624(-)
MSAYSATLSDDVMTTARKAFERYDHDDSGTIQIEEVVQALQDAKRDATEAQVKCLHRHECSDLTRCFNFWIHLGCRMEAQGFDFTNFWNFWRSFLSNTEITWLVSLVLLFQAECPKSR